MKNTDRSNLKQKKRLSIIVIQSRQLAGTLLIDGVEAGKGHIEKTNPNMFSLNESADAGIDKATNVSKYYKSGRGSHFNGKIDFVSIEITPSKTTAETDAEKKAEEVIAAAKD